jgi:hypothetical protein
MVGSSHRRLPTERPNSVENTLIVSGDNAPLHTRCGDYALIYMLDEEFTGPSGERFPREACRAKAGGYDGDDFHKLDPRGDDNGPKLLVQI